jgi:hypothetical protein
MNQNDLAKKVAHLEGKKINLTIEQVKEVLRCLKEVVRGLGESEKREILKRMFF